MKDPTKGVIQRVPVVPSPIAGTFTFPANPPTPANPAPIRAVMVKRPHTSPSRVEVVVGVLRTFRGTGGSLEESGKVTAIRWFDNAAGGNRIAFTNGVLALTPAQLNAGFHMFGESDTPSDAMDDYVLTLTLSGGPDPLAQPPTPVSLTAVRLTLDLFPPGPTSGPNATQPLPEPPAVPPAPGTATDKWFLGRTLNVQDTTREQRRAKIQVHRAEPSDFVGRLLLRQVAVTPANSIGALAARAALFDDDLPPPPQRRPAPVPALANPLVFGPLPIIGREFFVEGRALGAARRDVAFQLGLEGGEPDGDRVAFTIGVGCSISIGNTLRAVMVKKAPANPARQPVTLRTNVAFARQGTFNVVAGNAPNVRIQFFTALNGGAALALPLQVAGGQMSSRSGFRLFAEGLRASGGVDDIELSLTLSDGSPPAGLPASAKMTAVELRLDVCASRPAAGGEPPVMTVADKIAIGRFVQVASPTASHERAKLIVQAPVPGDFSCVVELRALGGRTPRVRAFSQEDLTAGQLVTLPETILSGLLPIGPFERFAEGIRPSAAALDTGFQVGIAGLDPDGDRAPMTALEFAVTENATAVAPALPAVRFGLWDRGYDAAGNVRADFVDNDRRRFHFHLRGPAGVATLQLPWRTVEADGTTNDDAPASELLTLSTPAGGGRLVSRGVMLVADDTDAAQTTPSGLVPPLALEPRTRGLADHRMRRAKIDGFVTSEIQVAAGQIHRLKIPVFDRAVPFDTRSRSVVAVGIATVVPTAMSGRAATGARWRIKVGSRLTIGSGAAREEVVVTAVTATTFTATFANAHNGSASAFRIEGRTDERRRLSVRVVRYLRPGVVAYVPATDPYIADQFARANLLWNQVGLQIDAQATVDRPLPAAAVDGSGLYAGSINNPQEQAAIADLIPIPITPDNTLTAVFVNLSAVVGANAYTTVGRRNPPIGDRFFIFIDTALNLEDVTLAHELHHALHNRFDVAVPNAFFTFNTNPPTGLGVPLPDVRIERRIQNRHSANPNVDPDNRNVVNWVRRERSVRNTVTGNLNPAADAKTGNTLTEDF
jgi:hypothetical protein